MRPIKWKVNSSNVVIYSAHLSPSRELPCLHLTPQHRNSRFCGNVASKVETEFPIVAPPGSYQSVFLLFNCIREVDLFGGFRLSTTAPNVAGKFVCNVHIWDQISVEIHTSHRFTQNLSFNLLQNSISSYISFSQFKY